MLSACVRSYDARIANSCSVEVTVKTYGVPPSRFDQDGPITKVALPPERVTEVPNAFHEAAGTSWTVLVEGSDHTIEVSKEEVEDSVILIPASACPSE
jgi:hypothetical protein